MALHFGTPTIVEAVWKAGVSHAPEGLRTILLACCPQPGCGTRLYVRDGVGLLPRVVPGTEPGTVICPGRVARPRRGHRARPCGQIVRLVGAR